MCFRMCWVQRRVEGGTSPDRFRKTVAYLVLQMWNLWLGAAWGVHGPRWNPVLRKGLPKTVRGQVRLLHEIYFRESVTGRIVDNY